MLFFFQLDKPREMHEQKKKEERKKDGADV